MNENNNLIVNEQQQRFWELARDAYRRQDWDAAETYYDQAIKAAPLNAKMHLYRGAVRCMKAQSIAERGAYLKALDRILVDYMKAYELAPDDPEVGISLIETELFKGSMDDAACHSLELFARITEPTWKGLCAWMGCVVCTLAGTPEDKWAELKRYLPLAGASIAATGWNTGDIGKHLTDYAAADVPEARVKAALRIHERVLGRVAESSVDTDRKEGSDVPWRKRMNDLTGTLAAGRTIPLSHLNELLSELTETASALSSGASPGDQARAQACKELSRIAIRQATVLATQVETAKDPDRSGREALCLKSLEYVDIAVRAASGDGDIRKAVVEMYRKAAALFVAEAEGAPMAITILERGCTMLPQDETLRALHASVKELAGK